MNLFKVYVLTESTAEEQRLTDLLSANGFNIKNTTSTEFTDENVPIYDVERQHMECPKCGDTIELPDIMPLDDKHELIQDENGECYYQTYLHETECPICGVSLTVSNEIEVTNFVLDWWDSNYLDEFEREEEERREEKRREREKKEYEEEMSYLNKLYYEG